jgi:hypothetical protein
MIWLGKDTVRVRGKWIWWGSPVLLSLSVCLSISLFLSSNSTVYIWTQPIPQKLPFLGQHPHPRGNCCSCSYFYHYRLILSALEWTNLASTCISQDTIRGWKLLASVMQYLWASFILLHVLMACSFLLLCSITYKYIKFYPFSSWFSWILSRIWLLWMNCYDTSAHFFPKTCFCIFWGNYVIFIFFYLWWIILLIFQR